MQIQGLSPNRLLCCVIDCLWEELSELARAACPCVSTSQHAFSAACTWLTHAATHGWPMRNVQVPIKAMKVAAHWKLPQHQLVSKDKPHRVYTPSPHLTARGLSCYIVVDGWELRIHCWKVGVQSSPPTDNELATSTGCYRSAVPNQEACTNTTPTTSPQKHRQQRWCITGSAATVLPQPQLPWHCAVL